MIPDYLSSFRGLTRYYLSAKKVGFLLKQQFFISEKIMSGRRYFHDDSEFSREKRPKGLRGREIGLWYAERSRRRRMERGELPKSVERKSKWKKPIGSILISESKKAKFTKILNETSTIYPKSFLKKTDSYEHLEENDFKNEFLNNITGSIIEKMKSKPTTSDFTKNEIYDKEFFEEWNEKKSNSLYQEMQEVRSKLPAMKKNAEILDLIKNNQVVVISGETGCGKTTQVAQFILDDFIARGEGSKCKIICTQPRRISAISVAERVACERADMLGNSVGYQIRLERALPRERGSILFCTTGILLKYMEDDPSLSKISHLILDEIHERDVLSDFLITLLKDVIKFRSDLKVILMSATLNSEAFSRYYDNAPHINIPGFTYPVEEHFLEDVLELTKYKYEDDKTLIWKLKRDAKRCKDWQDYIEPSIRKLEADNVYSRHVTTELWKPQSEQLVIDLIFQLLVRICEQNQDDGAILIFVPGFAEISTLCKRIRECVHLPSMKYIVIPLHSQLPTVDQRQIFNRPPKGMRKIIVATNIAETSITIDDVTTVIDSGYIKISNLDPETGIETLENEWVSQANAAQRKGRAGRVKPGICYHLISKARYELLDRFLKPEVLRKRLDDVILQLKMLQLGDAEPFLSKLMDSPDPQSVRMSLELLRRLGALNQQENLTPLGFQMAKLPVGAHCSKMLILASLFSCIDPVLSVVASLGFKDSFQLSVSDAKEADRKKAELAAGSNSDHLCMHYAIRGFENARNPRAFCREYFLSYPIVKTLIDMRKQLAQQLFEMKLVDTPHPKAPSNNRNSSNMGIVKAVIAAGLYPNVAIIQKVNRSRSVLQSTNNERMSFHKKSVLCQLRSFSIPLVVYYIRLKTKTLSIHDATLVYSLPFVFFGDQFRLHHDHDDDDDTEDGTKDTFRGVSVDNNIRFVCSESSSLIIQRLRDRFAHILEWKVSNPAFVDWTQNTAEVKILSIIRDLIANEESENLDLSDYDDV